MSSTGSGSARSTASAALPAPGGGDGVDRLPAAPAEVVPANDFGLTPVQVAPAQDIHYSEAVGIKLWNATSGTLPAKWAVDSEYLSRFNEHVVDREIQSGWDAPGASIVMIPDVDRVMRHLFHNY
jgi:hypothetical protein